MKAAGRLAPGRTFPAPFSAGVGAAPAPRGRFRRFNQFGDEELARAPRAVQRARAAGAVADDGHVRIALAEADALGRNTQVLAEDARERGLVALAGRLRHGVDVQVPRLVETRVRLVLGRDSRCARFEE